MGRKGRVGYGVFVNTKIVRLPCGDKKTAMYCITFIADRPFVLNN